MKAYARYEALDFNINVYTYKCNFDIPEDFGEIGAVLVENEYSKKMFFKTIVLSNNVTFTCESWVASKFDNPDKRIFFTDKVSFPLYQIGVAATINNRRQFVFIVLPAVENAGSPKAAERERYGISSWKWPRRA